MTIVENHLFAVTGGVDTHLDFHVAAAVDANGGVLGVETFDTTTGGYRRLVAWLAGFGIISVGRLSRNSALSHRGLLSLAGEPNLGWR